MTGKAKAAGSQKAGRGMSRTDRGYTDPALRERLKAEIRRGTRGGPAGRWSARKAQLLTAEYEKAGGGYTTKQRSAAQKHLGEWTDQEWTTKDGKPAARAGGTSRYLPKRAWDELTPGQKKATDAKKRAGSKAGKPVVANTKAAKAARKKAGA